MSGDVHVRFCEHLGGRFPGVTRLVVMVNGQRADAAALRQEVAELLAPIGLSLSVEKTRICHIGEGSTYSAGTFSVADGKVVAVSRRCTRIHPRRPWPR